MVRQVDFLALVSLQVVSEMNVKCKSHKLHGRTGGATLSIRRPSRPRPRRGASQRSGTKPREVRSCGGRMMKAKSAARKTTFFLLTIPRWDHVRSLQSTTSKQANRCSTCFLLLHDDSELKNSYRQRHCATTRRSLPWKGVQPPSIARDAAQLLQEKDQCLGRLFQSCATKNQRW